MRKVRLKSTSINIGGCQVPVINLEKRVGVFSWHPVDTITLTVWVHRRQAREDFMQQYYQLAELEG